MKGIFETHTILTLESDFVHNLAHINVMESACKWANQKGLEGHRVKNIRFEKHHGRYLLQADVEDKLGEKEQC